MILMMILMFLPVIAIPVFWFLPLGQAIAIYIVCLLLSGSMYWIMHTNMKRPVTTGRESLIDRETRIVSRSVSDKIAPYQVLIEGEIWSASSRDSLKIGDTVVIIAIKGNRLTIKCKADTKEAD